MKIEKIISKFKNSNKGQSFEDCVKVLIAKGYTMNTKQGKGKHVKFSKAGSPMIIIPKKNPVDPEAVNEAIKVWEE